MSGRTENLRLVIDASTARAVGKIARLQLQLGRLQKQGGLRGLGAGGLLTGLGAAKIGVAGLGASLSAATALAGGFMSVGTMAFRAVMMPVKLLASAVSGVLGGALRGVRLLTKTTMAALAAGIGSVWAGLKAMKPSGFMEQANLTMNIMMKNVDKAKSRMKWLTEFEIRTPFNIKELIQGANLFEAFGLFSKRTMEAAGDAASAFGKRIVDIVPVLAKLKSGIWETESLALFGITREKMRDYGLKFDPQGTLKSSGEEAFVATIGMIEKQYGGMMAKVAKTWNGLLSTISSRWFMMWANMGQGALPYLKPVLSEIIGVFDVVNQKMLSIDWSDVGTKLLLGVKTAGQVIKDLFDPIRRGEMKLAISETLERLPAALKAVGLGIAQDIASTLLSVLDSIRPLGAWFLDGLQGVFRFGAALLGEAWQNLTQYTQDRLKLMKPGGDAAIEILSRTERGRGILAEKEASSVTDIGGMVKITSRGPMYNSELRDLARKELAMQQRDNAGGTVGLGTAASEASRLTEWQTRKFTLASVGGLVSHDNTVAAAGQLKDAFRPILGYAAGAGLRAEGGFQSAVESMPTETLRRLAHGTDEQLLKMTEELDELRKVRTAVEQQARSQAELLAGIRALIGDAAEVETLWRHN